MSDVIKTRPTNAKYREGWDRIFNQSEPVYKCRKCNWFGRRPKVACTKKERHNQGVTNWHECPICGEVI